MNDFVLVGRLTRDVEVRQTPSGRQVAEITLGVRREFKNSEGNYDTDFINVTLWEYLATNMAEICSKGTMIILKGRVSTKKTTVGDVTITVPELIGETFMFCQNGKGSEE